LWHKSLIRLRNEVLPCGLVTITVFAFQACSFNHSDISTFIYVIYVDQQQYEHGCGRAVHQAHSRTPILLRFRTRLPSVEALRRWRERGKMGRR
jgi:hypothetical protein